MSKSITTIDKIQLKMNGAKLRYWQKERGLLEVFYGEMQEYKTIDQSYIDGIFEKIQTAIRRIDFYQRELKSISKER